MSSTRTLRASWVSVGLYNTYTGPGSRELPLLSECTIGLLYSYIPLAKNATDLCSPRIEIGTSHMRWICSIVQIFRLVTIFGSLKCSWWWKNYANYPFLLEVETLFHLSCLNRDAPSYSLCCHLPKLKEKQTEMVNAPGKCSFRKREV